MKDEEPIPKAVKAKKTSGINVEDLLGTSGYIFSYNPVPTQSITSAHTFTYEQREMASKYLADINREQSKILRRSEVFDDEEKLISPEHISTDPGGYLSKYYRTPIREGRIRVDEDEDRDEEDEHIEEENENIVTRDVIADVFYQYDETGDTFGIFKFLFDMNLINSGNSIFTGDWRRVGTSREAVTPAYRNKAIMLAESIVGSLDGYFGYSVSPQHREVLTDMLLEIYLELPDKLHIISIDNGEVLSDIISSCKSRNINIHNSIKELKNIDFNHYRRANICVKLGYISVFKTLFVVTRHCQMIPRTTISRAFMTIERDPIVSSYSGDEHVININGVDYCKKAFESILEIDIEEFLTNLNLESILSKDIADESVAGTGEIKSFS